MESYASSSRWLEFYFDPRSIEGVLEAHLGQLAIPTEQDVEAYRAELLHASEDYFRIYRTGAHSVGSFFEFAPMDEEPDHEFGEMAGLFLARSAEDFLDEDGLALHQIRTGSPQNAEKVATC